MILDFPRPYPDESLYSLLARHNWLRPLSSLKEMACNLLGSRNATAVVDLPGRLGSLAAAIGDETNFSVSALIRNHTLLPLYAHFLPSPRLAQLERDMASMRVDRVLNVSELSWWVNLLPPAWFAGLDDAFSGSGMLGSWILAAIGLGATALVLWIAFDKLARDYEIGLQVLNEMVSTPIKRGSRRRLIDRMVNLPPLSWWLRDPVTRASFLLTSAYLIRDRDVKLRVYPGIAPILIIPFIFLIQNHGHGGSNDPGFGVPFSGIYLGMVPLLGLQMLQFSQQWQAADIFRAAPLPGPAAICHGARRAVLCLLALPMMLLVALIVWLMRGNLSQLVLFLPGIIALPVFALVPNLGGHGVPLSQPTDAAKSATRGLNMIVVMIIAFALAGVTSFSWTQGWFWWLVLGEAVVAVSLYSGMRLALAKANWPSNE